MLRFIAGLICGALLWYAWSNRGTAAADPTHEPDSAALAVERAGSGGNSDTVVMDTTRPAPTMTRTCDGRTYCSQMTSCEEATWFLRNCPGMKMDGEGDGIPCERQWCPGS
jgi:hypothetical protein